MPCVASEAFTDRLRPRTPTAGCPRSACRIWCAVSAVVFAVGIDRRQAAPEPDMPDMMAHNEIALQIARQGIVLLANGGILRYRPTRPRASPSSAGTRSSVCRSAVDPVPSCPPGAYADVIPIGRARPDPAR